MAIERTLAIVKPDAVAKGATGEILRRIEAKGLRIIGLKKLVLREQLARASTPSTSSGPSSRTWWPS